MPVFVFSFIYTLLTHFLFKVRLSFHLIFKVIGAFSV